METNVANWFGGNLGFTLYSLEKLIEWKQMLYSFDLSSLFYFSLLAREIN